MHWPSPSSERGSWRGSSKNSFLLTAAILFILPLLPSTLVAEEPPARQAGPIDLIRAYTRTQLGSAGFTRHETAASGEEAADGHDLVWWEAGEGPAVVMIHGVSDQAGSWCLVAPQLAESYRVLLVDLPGHGESTPESGPLKMTTVLEGFESWLSQHAITEGGEPPVLVGNSMGAWIALLTAHRHPEWLSRVIVVNGGPLHFDPPEGLSLMPEDREAARAVMAVLRDPSSPATPDPILDDLVRRVEFNETRRMFEAEDDLNRYLFSDEKLRGITTPVDLVWGTSDRYLGEEYPKRLMAGLPNARLQTLDSCGHIPQAECPVPFLATLEKVLELSVQGAEKNEVIDD